jgi:hypothetical protein
MAVDEFDLDLRLGELGRWWGTAGVLDPRAAKTDPDDCVPTGGAGAEGGGTCDTDDTCPGTCQGRDTCRTCDTLCGTQCNTHSTPADADRATHPDAPPRPPRPRPTDP